MKAQTWAFIILSDDILTQASHTEKGMQFAHLFGHLAGNRGRQT